MFGRGKAGRLLPACFFAVFILFPAFSQEDREGEDFSEDDYLLMEDEGLTVTASPETTQQIKIITKEEIDRINAPDLAVLLQEAAGLGLTSYGPYGNPVHINMRGFDSQRVAFLVNGVPVNSPTTGEFDISQIDLQAVEKIEVIYGGSDSKYNVTGALGGVINIITVKKQKPGLRAGVSVSNTSALPGVYTDRNGKKAGEEWEDLYDTQNAAVSLGFGAEDFSVTGNIFANRAQNHFLFTDSNNKIRRKDNNEVYDAGAAASLVLNLPDESSLILSGDMYYGDKNVPTSGFSRVAGKQIDSASRQNIMLDMPRIFRDDLAVEASLTHGWHVWDYEISNSSSHHNQHTVSAINRWDWLVMNTLTLRGGGDYRYIRLDSTDMGNEDRHDGGLYLTVDWFPGESFRIIPSIKVVSDGDALVPVPKLGFAWYAADRLTFKNNYFRSFKFPDFEDLYWPRDSYAEGNPNLKPEDGWGADFTVEYRFADWANLDSTLFYEWTDDSIHWAAGGGGIWRPQNVGEAVFFGWDTKIRFSSDVSFGPIEKAGISFSYQYLQSYLLSYGYTYSSEKRIPYMPQHTAGFSLDISWKTGSVLITGHYETLRYADTANLTEMDSPFLIDIILNQKINKNLTLFAALRNALNESYVSMQNYYMPGITLTTGIKAVFE
jgi:vitamin B12 transporter